MANPSVGFGLRPARRVDGAALNFALTEYQIAYNNTNAMCTGDLVIPLSTGYIDIWASAALSLGVFMGCSYFSAAVGRTIWSPRWPGVSLVDSTLKVKAWVMNDPKVVCEVRTSVAPATIADIGANASMTATTGDTVTGQSKWTLDGTTMDSTNTFPLKIVGIATKPDIDNTLVGNIAQVVLNSQAYTLILGV
jgi:hypothetical protein